MPTLLDRRKDKLIRSGKRTNFERRDNIRFLINGDIFLDYKFEAKLINIDFKGCCVASSKSDFEGNIAVDLNPYLNLKLDTKIIWKEDNSDENITLYGFEFVFLTPEKTNLLKDIFFLNTHFFIDHANAINEQVQNLKIKNEVLDFFVYDVKAVVEKLIDIENKVKNSEELNLTIYQNIANILDGLLYKGNCLAVLINDTRIEQKIKQRVRAILGYFLYQSKIIRRALEKPHGYPGDYIMLEQVYNKKVVSEGILATYIETIFLNTPYAAAIRGRKNWMREKIKEVLSVKTKDDYQILNLASGSVRELRELFANFKSARPTTITCLDQDIASINFSKDELNKINTDPVKIDFLEENILHLDKAAVPPKIDMIYSIGIADYLQDRMLDKIFKDSFNLLKSNGKLIFAYKDYDKHKPLLLNWFCDWNFISRNEKEFVGLVEKALDGQKYTLEIEREPETNIIFFVVITKLS